jgi:hypothetical protein
MYCAKKTTKLNLRNSLRMCGPDIFTTIRNLKIGKGTAREKGIDGNFTRGPPDSPEKKTEGKGRGERGKCVPA